MRQAVIGWADIIREKVRDPCPLLDQTDVTRDIADITTKIGNVAFEEAYNKGRTMTLDEMVAYALAESE